MARLPLTMSLFLSFSMSAIVALLSLLAGVTLTTLMFRTLIIFFVFGLLGALVGSLLEVLLMPATTKIEREKFQGEIEVKDEEIEASLGDLAPNRTSVEQTAPASTDSPKSPAADFKPAVFPHFSDENGKAVSHGDSIVVS